MNYNVRGNFQTPTMISYKSCHIISERQPIFAHQQNQRIETKINQQRPPWNARKSKPNLSNSKYIFTQSLYSFTTLLLNSAILVAHSNTTKDQIQLYFVFIIYLPWVILFTIHLYRERAYIVTQWNFWTLTWSNGAQGLLRMELSVVQIISAHGRKMWVHCVKVRERVTSRKNSLIRWEWTAAIHIRVRWFDPSSVATDFYDFFAWLLYAK